MFVKGPHERQFAYEAHTAWGKHGFVLGVEVTAGNVSDRAVWDAVYDNTVNDSFICPKGHELRHTTTGKEGKRTYRSPNKICKDCPCRTVCGANENGQRILTTHIWQEFLDLAEQLRKTDRGKEIYAMRKETIERVFADAKEKLAMRYTHHRGLPRVSAWVRLKYAAMNLKKLAVWKWNRSSFFVLLVNFLFNTAKTPVLVV